jgi:hypothetical protein
MNIPFKPAYMMMCCRMAMCRLRGGGIFREKDKQTKQVFDFINGRAR